MTRSHTTITLRGGGSMGSISAGVYTSIIL